MKCFELSFFQVGLSHFTITLCLVRVEWGICVLNVGRKASRRTICGNMSRVFIFLELLCIIANTAVSYSRLEIFWICTWKKNIVGKTGLKENNLNLNRGWCDEKLVMTYEYELCHIYIVFLVRVELGFSAPQKVIEFNEKF